MLDKLDMFWKCRTLLQGGSKILHGEGEGVGVIGWYLGVAESIKHTPNVSGLKIEIRAGNWNLIITENQYTRNTS